MKVEYSDDFSYDSWFPTYIETDSLIMRGPVYEVWDLNDFYEFHNTPEGEKMAKYNDFERPKTIPAATEIYDYMKKGWEENTRAYYTIEEKNQSVSFDYDYIGICGIDFIEWDKNRAEIGIWLHPKFWGNGYSSERAVALCDVIFNVLDLEVTLISVAQVNEKSVRAVEKYVTALGGEKIGRIANEKQLVGVGVLDGIVFQIEREDYIENTPVEL